GNHARLLTGGHLRLQGRRIGLAPACLVVGVGQVPVGAPALAGIAATAHCGLEVVPAVGGRRAADDLRGHRLPRVKNSSLGRMPVTLASRLLMAKKAAMAAMSHTSS